MDSRRYQNEAKLFADMIKNTELGPPTTQNRPNIDQGGDGSGELQLRDLKQELNWCHEDLEDLSGRIQELRDEKDRVEDQLTRLQAQQELEGTRENNAKYRGLAMPPQHRDSLKPRSRPRPVQSGTEYVAGDIAISPKLEPRPQEPGSGPDADLTLDGINEEEPA